MGITRHLFEREFAAHGREQRRIEITGERQDAIRDPALAAEQSRRGHQHGIEPPGRFRREGWSGRRPDQSAGRIVAYLWVGIEPLVFEGLQMGLVQLELELEGPIGQVAPAAGAWPGLGPASPRRS
jgi:hypothetical protein